MIKLIMFNFLGYPDGILDLKKEFYKNPKNIPVTSRDLLMIAWKCMKIDLIV